MNSLISKHGKQLDDFENDIKTKEKHVKVTPEDLGKDSENNPFNASIIEESMVEIHIKFIRMHAM